MNGRRNTPRLWKDNDYDEKQEWQAETFNDLLARFSYRPPSRSLWEIVCSSLVVGQEFALTCLLLARHRAAMQDQQDDNHWQQVASVIVLPLILILFFGEQITSATRRACDVFLLAGMLRLVSSVLRTLTASYSSDTVYALAIAGMLVHLLACDYGYANGRSKKKAAGIISLNATLFSTTLLASRLTSNATVYVFVSTSVILFAFYPAARHGLAVTFQEHASIVFLIINVAISVATWVLLETTQEKVLFGGILTAICVLAPWWEYAVLQQHKLLLSGPWDIAHIHVQGDES